MPQETLGTLFKRLRAHSGLSQEQLAERAGLSHRTVGDIESGVRRRRRAVTLNLLADALGITAHERAELLRTALEEGLGAPHESLPGGLRLPRAPALIGRDDALAGLRAAFDADGRALVTLTGPPGVGKTALALAFARETAARYPGGVAFAALDAVRDAASVLPEIARALGVEEGDRGPNLRENLVDRLRGAAMLLVLDNVEHVLDAGPAIAELLRAAAGTSVLATGRSPFNLSNEREIVLAPLARDDAVALFVERAGAVVDGYVPDAAEREHVERICATLEGLPLAIELAALRMRSFTAGHLAERIWELLGEGPRDAAPRHRALDAAIAWSYDLLDERNATAWRRLAVFDGSATVDALKGVCDMHAPAIDALVRQNLLAIEGQGSQRRLRLLAPMRAFAMARLEASGEIALARDRHARYFCELSESMTGRSSESLRGVLETFDAERANFRAALAWANDGGVWETGARTAAALGDLWRVRNALGEAVECFEALAAVPGDRDARLRWRMLDGALWFNIRLGRLERARPYAEAGLEAAASIGDPAVVAAALARCGLLEYYGGNLAAADTLSDRAVALCAALDDPRLHAIVYNVRGMCRLESGEPADAVRVLSRALDRSQAASNDAFSVVPLLNLSEASKRLGEIGEAERYSARALDLAIALDYPTMIARSRALRAELALLRDDARSARDELIGTFELLFGTQEPETVLIALQIAARYFNAAGRHREAAMLLGLWRRRHQRLQNEFPDERRQSETDLASARESLGTQAFEEYREIGRTLVLDDVLELLREVEPATR
jgi:predicted ATPase/transcriptional regulator with XRE-family HTH domain